MINQVLKLKHWVFFVLVYGLPTIIQFIGFQGFASNMNGIITKIEPNGKQVEEVFTNMFNTMFTIMPFIIGIPIIVIFIWLISVGLGLQKKLPLKLQKNTIFFILANITSGTLVFLAFYKMMNFFGSFFYTMFNNIENDNMQNFIPDFSSLSIVPLLFMTALITYIYVFYFAAKTIKTAETQKEMKFGDFASEFFLIVFFPIGVWILQPRINKLVLAEETAFISDEGEKVSVIDEML